MSCSVEIRLTSDNLLELRALVDNSTTPATEVTGATVNASLFDKATGDAIPGFTNPTLMPSVGGTNTYRVTVPDAGLTLTLGQRLTVRIVADAGAGLLRTFVADGIVVEG